jgi:phage replication O-like protein O
VSSPAPRSAFPRGPFVPVPADYLDRLMPALHESEWRVLLVVLRQTLGWADPSGAGGRKERDWITAGQFAQKTGLHRDSVSRAVRSLVTMGLLRVESATGEVLDTPQLRRRHGSRLYYRPLTPPTHE